MSTWDVPAPGRARLPLPSSLCCHSVAGSQCTDTCLGEGSAAASLGSAPNILGCQPHGGPDSTGKAATGMLMATLHVLCSTWGAQGK